MSKELIVFALALLIIIPMVPASVGTADDLRAPRASILFDGDAAFTADNGVRSGSGTADDPYVISDWTIVNTDSYGIRLIGTRQHVVIERVDIVAHHGPHAIVRCSTGDPSDCARNAVDIRDAENITLRQSTLTYAGYGLLVRGAKHLQVSDIELVVPNRAVDIVGGQDMTFERMVIQGEEIGAPVNFQPRGFVVEDVEALTLRDITITRASVNVRATDARHLTIENSHFGASAFAGFDIVGDSHNLTLRGNVFESQSVSYANAAADVRVIDNQFVGPNSDLSHGGVVAGQPHHVARLLICGNSFDAPHVSGNNIFISDSDGARILANRFAPTRNGIGVLDSQNVQIAANDFQTYGTAIFVYEATGLSIHGNAFATTGNATWTLRDGGPIDAAGNWWGDASGPSGVGPGTGAAILDPYGRVTFAPWLTARPVVGPGAVDCDDPTTWP